MQTSRFNKNIKVTQVKLQKPTVGNLCKHRHLMKWKHSASKVAALEIILSHSFKQSVSRRNKKPDGAAFVRLQAADGLHVCAFLEIGTTWENESVSSVFLRAATKIPTPSCVSIDTRNNVTAEGKEWLKLIRAMKASASSAKCAQHFQA